MYTHLVDSKKKSLVVSLAIHLHPRVSVRRICVCIRMSISCVCVFVAEKGVSERMQVIVVTLKYVILFVFSRNKINGSFRGPYLKGKAREMVS